MDKPLPTTLTARIPQELFDKIISHLHLSTYVLTTCALVCKAWLPSARHHLLAPHPRPPHAFAPVLIQRSTAPALLALLSAPHCTLRTAIRAVCIRPDERVRLRRFAPPLLERLERLAVCPASYGPLREDLVGWVAGYAGSLTELVLVDVDSLSFIRFLGLLRELKGLRHLGVVDVMWVDTEWEVDGVVRPEGEKGGPVPHLRSVVLGGFSINVLNWLARARRSSGAPQIASLDLRVDASTASHLRAHTERLVAGYYRTLGRTLRELDLYETEHGSIDLQHIPGLQRVWFHGVTVNGARSIQWVTRALRTVAASPRTVTLEVAAGPGIAVAGQDRDGDDGEWVRALVGAVRDRAGFAGPLGVEVEVGVEVVLPDALLGRAGLVRACLEVGFGIVRRGPAPRFGFLRCGRVEERVG